MRTLDVYFDALRAGRLTQDARGAMAFAYAPDYLADPAARAISISMPLGPARFEDHVARPYFSGLLPDEGARHRLAAALGVSAANAFGLLEIIGGDCAGALSLHPADTAPFAATRGDVDWLDDARLGQIVARLRERPLLGGEDGIRLSLAGAQDKLAVCADDHRIGLPRDGLPTTHILKPSIMTLDGSVENELFCLRLAKRIGLTVVQADLRPAGGAPALLVRRYDRQTGKGTVLRLHQEDFCQALGVPPEIKYEAEGGPGVTQSLALVDRVCARPAADRLEFIRRLIFHCLVGNADAHAKNHALLYRNVAPDLAPVYDVLCTAVYPRLHKSLAMKIGERDRPDTIRLEDWATLMPPGRAGVRLMTRELQGMASRIGDEADQLMHDLAQAGIDHPVLARIRELIETRRSHLLRIIGT